MTPGHIIDGVRRIIQDGQLLRTTTEYADATLLSFVNQVLRHTATLRPDLFALMADIQTVPNVVEQSMPDDSIRLISVFGVKGGNAITEVSREVMDQSYPQWRSDPSGQPVNFMRHIRNPNRYFVYPRPSEGVVLSGEYAQTPPIYSIDDQIALLPEAFEPTIAAGVVMLTAGIDSASANPERFKQFQDLYSQTLGTNQQQRTVTDTKQSSFPSTLTPAKQEPVI